MCEPRLSMVIQGAGSGDSGFALRCVHEPGPLGADMAGRSALLASECRRSCSEGSVRGRIHVGLEAVSNPRGGGFHGVPCKVGVARGRVDPHTNPTR